MSKLTCKVYISLPSRTKLHHQIKYCHQINVGGQSTINWTTKIQRSTLIKIFFCHTIGDEMLYVTICVVMENFRLLQAWRPFHSIANCLAIEFFSITTWLAIKKIGCCKVGDCNFSIVARFMATKTSLISITISLFR